MARQIQRAIAMKNEVSKAQRLDLVELSRRSGLILRQPDSATIGHLFTRLEEYDEQERAHIRFSKARYQ